MNNPNFNYFEEGSELETHPEDVEAYNEYEQQEHEEEVAKTPIVKRSIKALGEFVINRINRNLQRRIEQEDREYAEYIRRR